MKRLHLVSLMLLAACPELPVSPIDAGALLEPACREGQCAPICSAGKTSCNGLCVDTQINANHCGGCGNTCSSNQTCVAGGCGCPTGYSLCGGQCVETTSDPSRCGGCNIQCPANAACVDSACVVAAKCGGDQVQCGQTCRDVLTDNANCGACGDACGSDKVCVNGTCGCTASYTACNGSCANLQLDVRNCGACGQACGAGEACLGGTCTVTCATNQTACGGQCVDTSSSVNHCGACGQSCGPTELCNKGSCEVCDSASTDCDGDGFTVAQGDCCDNLLGCSTPAQVNPGALELPTNFIDDNCNGLVDTADVAELSGCDSLLQTNSSVAGDYAKAMGLCRTATETDRKWGVISAELLRANGAPLGVSAAKSIRNHFGNIKALEGDALAVLSSGIASDATQTLPGPNQGPSMSPSHDFSSSVDLLACAAPSCIKDWLVTANLPLKKANELPVAPSCSSGSANAATAKDSVMVKLRIRAPTNARSFSLSAFFFSSEYPEFVCSSYNDQVLVLVDTPGGFTSPANPIDKNLLTYQSGSQSWPVGINLAGGTSLFSLCESKSANQSCWDTDVNVQSCSGGPQLLEGTGFEAPTSGGCTNGGGTHWLTTVGNVRPGEIVELRFVIWDVGDGILDSLVLFDNFKWDVNARTPGTSG